MTHRSFDPNLTSTLERSVSRAIDQSISRSKRETLRLKPKAEKPRKRTHQDALEAGIGKIIQVVHARTGENARGTLIAADQFSITIFDGADEVTIFKHAISQFWFV